MLASIFSKYMTKVYPLSKIKYHPAKGIFRYRSIIVASGILILANRVLLIKRSKNNLPDPGSWILPSGHVEQHETPEKAAVREFLEETGLKVRAKRLVSIEHYFYDEKKTRVLINEFIYEVEIDKPKDVKVRLDGKHSDYCFASPKELSHFRSLVSPRLNAIRKVFKFSSKKI